MILLGQWRHRAIRVRNEQDRLIAAGYRWDEWRLIQHAGLAALAIASSIITPLVLASKGQADAIMGALVGLPFLCLLSWRVMHPKTIIFTHKGRVLAPNGIAGRFWVRDLCALSEVSSIELTSACQGFGVVLFTTEGDTILLAERMFKADARRVAVQLTKARDEMRASMADITSRLGGVERSLAWVD